MRKKNSILVVDDSKVDQKLFKTFLEKEDYNVFTASTVSEGLFLLGNDDIGIALVDFDLAGLNTGKALVEKLKKYKVDVTIYAISYSEENSIELLNCGCNGIIPKNSKLLNSFSGTF